MIKNEIDSINTRRVLDWFLEHPDRLSTYDELKYLRELTAESRIREALRKLAHGKILIVDNPRGRPRKREDEQDARRRWRINCDLDAFSRLFRIYFDNEIEKFLRSNYTNSVIAKCGFCSIYEIIKDRLEVSRFRRIASRALLNQPATIAEFKSIPQYAINYLDEMKEVPIRLSDLRFSDVENLKYFDPIEAVSFCRNNLCKVFSDMHNKIGGRKIIHFGKNLIQYNELDLYLSPFMSYPVHDPLQLLFSRPFNRLYEDVYLLDKSDFQLFIKRAFLVFTNFADYIYIYFENLCSPLDLDKSVRELALLWNIAKFQIDRCVMNLEHLCSKKEGSGRYHLLSKGPLVQIEDLEDGKELLYNAEYWELSRGDGPLAHIDEPFDYLMPCLSFRELGNERPIPVEDIKRFVKYKFKSSGSET